MKIADVTISGVTATAEILSKIPAGLIGGTVGLSFPDPYWGRMVKNAKFRAQGLPDIPPILGVGDTVTIPAVLVAVPNYRLEIGIVGVTEDGAAEITPTLWADLGVVRPSAGYIPEEEPEGGGEIPEANPETWAQLLAMIGNVQNLTTEQKSSLVAAVNEVNAKAGDVPELRELVEALGETLEPVVAQVDALTAENAQQGNIIARHEADIADLKYVPMDITSISDTVGTIPAGTILKALTISWTVNKAPVSQSISSGQELTPEQRSITLGEDDLVNVRAEKAFTHSFTITATDERGKSDKATASVVFQNYVWYGSAPIPAAIDSAFVRGLPKKVMTDTRKRSFAMSDAEGYYTWYVCPVRLGACAFKTNGFDGGLSLAVAEPVLIENELGYAENCYVYRSDYDGQTGVNVEVI